MDTIDHHQLRAFDLNLLVALDVLMQERSVTRAATKLKIQQPAMSSTLSTLRTLLDDALFIRTGQTMAPTPRAQALHALMRPLLLQIQDALAPPAAFDPARAERTFRLGINGQLEVMLVPRLIADIGRHAPGVRIETVQIGGRDPMILLDADEIDLAIGHISESAPWHHRETLYEEQHLCCFNPTLLPFPTPITRDAYFSAAHGVVSAKDSLPGYLDYLLASSTLPMALTMSSHSVMTLFATAAETPLIATLARSVVLEYAPRFGLVSSPLPFAVRDLQIDMMWHARGDNDSALAWLKSLVRTHAD